MAATVRGRGQSGFATGGGVATGPLFAGGPPAEVGAVVGIAGGLVGAVVGRGVSGFGGGAGCGLGDPGTRGVTATGAMTVKVADDIGV
jgi:hypothetical protein